MRPSILAMEMSGFIKGVQDFALPDDFTATSSNNEEAEREHKAYQSMLRFVKANALRATADKMYSKAKEDIDQAVIAQGLDPEIEDDTQQTLLSTNGLTFIKRRNKTTTQLNPKKFLAELHKLGVDPALIRKAEEAATETKRGSTYYNVGVDGDAQDN